MSVTISTTNKPLNPRAQDLSPKGYNRASLYSGKALDFDGVNDYVSVGDNASLDFTTAMSAFCYVKVDSLASLDDYLLSKYDYGNNKRSWVMVQDAGQLLVLISKNGFSASPNAKKYIADVFQSTNEYYFVGFTFESNVLKVYVNGQEYTDVIKDIDSEVNSIYVSDVNVGVGCGHFAGSPSNFINGQVSGVRLFNTALTAAQVSDLYLNPEKIVPDGVANSALKLWLPMMEGAGTTAYDGSGNGNHGTISGATWVSGVGAPVAQTALVGWNKGVNLALYSEQFDNAAWAKSLCTITANQIVSPSGYLDADLVTTSGTSDALQQSFSVTSGTTYTFSGFIKSGTADTVSLVVFGSFATSAGTYNLTNGTATSGVGSPVVSIQDYGNDWYRATLTATATSTGTANFYFGSASANAISTYHVWGAQVTATSDVQPYIPTLATAQTSPVLLPQGLTANKDITGVNSVSRNAYALNLDGASWAEVHDNASLDFGSAVSLEAWVYWQGDNNDDGILGRYGSTTAERDCSLYAYSLGIQFYITTNAVSYTSMTNGWRHIVGTYDGANKRLYVDGVQVNFSAETSIMPNGSIPMEIGRYKQSALTTFTQPIALPRIYNRALTATEVARNYNADKSKFGL